MCVESQSTVDGIASRERRYYITSLDAGHPRRIAESIRGHWGTKNRLHWCLDVGFRKDDSRIRLGHAAQNYSQLRSLALNLLNQNETRKVGLKGKITACGWDQDYLMSSLKAADSK